MCSSITFRVSWRTWLSVPELIRPKLPAPEREGRLAEYAGVGPLLVAVVDLNELSGRVAGAGCDDGIFMGWVASMGELETEDACSLATSARGARLGGFFGVLDADVFDTGGLGAGRVYTVGLLACEDTARGYKHTLGEETAVAIDQVFAQEPAIAEFVIAFNQLDTIAFRKAQLVRAAGLEVI